VGVGVWVGVNVAEGVGVGMVGVISAVGEAVWGGSGADGLVPLTWVGATLEGAGCVEQAARSRVIKQISR